MTLKCLFHNRRREIAGVDNFNWEIFADRQEAQDNHIK